MKKLILLLFLIFVFPANAEVIHNISLEGDLAVINSTLILKSDEKIDYWNLKIMLPENAEIVELKDEISKINYNFSKSELVFRTNKKKANTRIVNLIFKKKIEEKYGLKIVDLDLFGFENETTIIAARNVPYFFVPMAQIEYGKEIKAKKKGGCNLRIIYGGKKESEHYFTNSNFNLSLVERYYFVPERITGLKIPVKFPVVVLPDEKYNKELEIFSSGTFRKGIIFVRENLSEKEKIATILHETTHGFNSFVLDFDKTNISWFDEGVACYVTSVIFRILNETKPQIFGEEIRWRNGTTIYSLKPKLKPEDLFEYYKKGDNWMLDWNPKKYRDEYKREFGYSYSELFIREYLFENGSLHKIYKRLLEINKSVENKDERNKIILDIFEKEFKPCYSLNLEEIRNCTRKLNMMSFEIPATEGKEITYKVEVPKIHIEENNSLFSDFENFFNKICEIFDSFIEKILKLI